MHACSHRIEPDQVSPTSSAPPRNTISSSSRTSNASPPDHRMPDFGNYRRDLAVLETSGGGRVPQIQTNPPTASASSNPIAPWSTPTNGSSNNNHTATPSSAIFGTSFYNDSSDNLSQGSQLSPGFRSNANASDSPADAYFGDGDARRPSVASVTTASSTGSKSSASRGAGIHKKLQTFFGEDFPGKDASDTSLPSHKDTPSHSFARSQRERNASSATDQTQRDASPAPSRPRTPVPSSDVVPFLYQDSQVRKRDACSTESTAVYLLQQPNANPWALGHLEIRRSSCQAKTIRT